MHFENRELFNLQALKINNNIKLKIDNFEITLSLRQAKHICDLLAIVSYDESIISLIAKRRILYDMLEEAKEKLNNVHQYFRRKNGKTYNKRAI